MNDDATTPTTSNAGDALADPQQALRARLRALWHELEPTPPHPCSYLPDQLAISRGFRAPTLHPEVYHELMDLGYRRSGDTFYAMDCATCRRCVPIRVAVEQFQPSRSQRRAFRRNLDLTVRVQTPQFTDASYELFARYQRGQHQKPDVEPPESVRRWLYDAVVDSVEMVYQLGERTLAISLLDVSSRSVSAVYHFFDPEFAARSLGVFSVLTEIEWTRRLGVPHYYLGYWVQGARTMAYKADYRPHEVLRDGRWQRG